jgi:hypothetical protein
MQSSRFQIGLIATLAMGLGFSVASSEAVGYPSGPTVSTGANPVISQGGVLLLGGTDTVLTAPADQDIVVTDIVLGVTNATYYCEGSFQVAAMVGSELKGQFAVGTPNLEQGQIRNEIISLNSGIRVPAGSSLNLEFNYHYRDCSDSSFRLNYTASGYYAQP